jgi:hypothetical protein
MGCVNKVFYLHNKFVNFIYIPVCTPFLQWLFGFLSATAVAAQKVSGSDESSTMPRFSRWGQRWLQNDGQQSIH